ncbi:MAG: RHS repeat-associated core domain-containing protein, partial [Acidimicrobiales bacterium]
MAAAYSYDSASHLKLTTVAATLSAETRDWDRAGRLSAITTLSPVGGLSALSYTLDPVGNVSQASEPAGPTTYTYDTRDRLTKACYATTTCAGATDFIGYGYDAVGNRSTETRPIGTTNYTYDDSDRLTAATGPASSVTYNYDPNGNQTQAGIRSFTYDAANRLSSTTASGTTASYAYDGDGLRLRASTGAAPAQVTNFAWDINSSLPEVAHERDGAGAMLRKYTYGSGRVAMTSGGADHYYHGDRLGSVVGVSGNFGTPEATYSYEPYGLPRTTTGTLANPMRFTGQYTDDTGLQYLRERYYDQGTGRFLSNDPVPPAITDPYVAAYVYANNQPTVAMDPSGLFCFFCLSTLSI